jgi:hypothetical protein
MCLPLYKFSYATVSAESIAPIPWIHVSGKNRLFAVFETTLVQLDDGRVDGRQKLKVLQDPEVMVSQPGLYSIRHSFLCSKLTCPQEDLDLNLLSVEAQRSMAQASNMMSSAQIPEVAVIVKVPNIAMKYPMTNGQVVPSDSQAFLAHHATVPSISDSIYA